jgi:hypothetical protein
VRADASCRSFRGNGSRYPYAVNICGRGKIGGAYRLHQVASACVETSISVGWRLCRVWRSAAAKVSPEVACRASRLPECRMSGLKVSYPLAHTHLARVGDTERPVHRLRERGRAVREGARDFRYPPVTGHESKGGRWGRRSAARMAPSTPVLAFFRRAGSPLHSQPGHQRHTRLSAPDVGLRSTLQPYLPVFALTVPLPAGHDVRSDGRSSQAPACPSRHRVSTDKLGRGAVRRRYG